MIHYVFYTLLWAGIVIEAVSVYLDSRVMTRRGRISSMWGVALGIFAIFGVYGVFLSSEQGRLARELVAAWALIGFQITFHGLYPILRAYRYR